MVSEFRLTSLATQAAVLIAVFATLASSISLSPSVSQNLFDPLLVLGEDTIGRFMLENPPENFTNALVSQAPNCTGLIDNVDASTLNSSAWSCASSPLLVPRRRRVPSRIPIFNTYSYSATYDDGDGNGYNITYPTQLCSFNVVGDVVSPNGPLVQNATLQSVWTLLAGLSAEELYNYTETMLQNAVNKFEAEIEAAICDPPVGGSRGLLTRYRASQVSGKWVLGLTGLAGSFGVAWGGLYVPIAHPGPTANFTKTDDVSLIAASTAAGFILTFALNALNKAEITNVIEAFILTVVVTIAEVFFSLFQQAWRGICTTTIILLAEVGEFYLRMRNNLVVVGDGNNLPPAVQMVPQNPVQQAPQAPQPPPQVQLHNVCG